MIGSRAALFLLLAGALCALGCASSPGEKAAEPEAAPEPEGPPPVVVRPGNLFPNPSFEEGRAPWYSLAMPSKPYWADFQVSPAYSHSGSYSAVLPLRSEGFRGQARIYGIIQEITPPEMPRRIGGWYRVENWRRGAKNQYLQVVVIAWRPQNVPAYKDSNVQISYVLGGIDSPPFRISNRRFVFTGPLEPVQGEWVHFEFDLHEGFLEHWGILPGEFGKLRILYEVRFDGRREPAPIATADVYYDDLYVGP